MRRQLTGRPRPAIYWLTAFFIAVGAASTAWAQAAPIPPDLQARVTTELAPGLYTFGSFAARSVFVVTPGGVIASDPVSPAFAADYRKAIAAITPLPVKFLIYSHQHWDHVRGGRIFKDESATVISHENCLAHFRAHPDPDVVMPDRTIKGDDAVTLGGKTLRLFYFGPNHGDCMLVMQLAGTDVLYVNDLVTPYSVGLGFMPDYDPGGWVLTLRRLEERDDWTRMVGGHGIPVAPRDALVQRRRFMEQLMAAVKAGVDAGKSADEIAATIALPEFKSVRGYDAQIGRAAERIYHYYTMGW